MAEVLKARPAEVRDAAAMARIYNQGIEDRIATFETDPRTPAAVEGMLAGRADRYPVVVVEEGDQLLGFAWTSEYRSREAYAGVAERRGFWKLVSRVFPNNAASRRLCANLGFREVGVYRRHGKLDGRWMDCVIVERLLGD